jgi:hypothetical protein
MHRLPSRSVRPTLVTLLALVVGACASLPAPGHRQPAGMANRFQQVLDSIETAVSLEADEVATAPRIRLVVPPASFAMDRYVESSFHLSADAYVLVVAVDLDRRVRVLHPESPDESGFAASRESNRLTRFFAGFGSARTHGGSYYTRYDLAQRISPFGGGGVLLAIASDRPLQFDRLLGPDGDWDEQIMSRLVFDQTLSSAARALGRAVVLTGQDFNTDYTTFAGDRSLGAYAFASSRIDACGFSWGNSRLDSWYEDRGLGFAPTFDAVTRLVGFFQRDGQTFARYALGGCAGATYYDVPVGGRPQPVPPDSTASPDTSTKRQPRYPGAPRFPSVAGGGREVHVRLSPAERDGRERPLTASGLRFRNPGELPEAGERPADIRLAPRESGVSRVPQRTVERQQLPERTLEPRAERVREAQQVREAPAREAPAREATPQRETPQREPVQREPVQREPVQREPVHREPVERPSLPAAPTTP